MNFTIGDQEYRAEKLDAFVQTHLVRRLAPILTGIGAAFQSYQKGDPMPALERVGAVIHGLSDEDTDFIQKTCLKAVQIKQGQLWANVYSEGGLQFEHIDFVTLNEIVFYVLRDNLGPIYAEITRRGWSIPAVPESSS